MNAEYEKLQLSDKDCVLEAVAATLERQLIPAKPILEIFKDDLGIRDKVLQEATKDECGHASIHVLYHLLSNFPEHFSNVLLLESQNTQKPFVNESWKRHFYFLAQSHKGNWMAGSPANYRPGISQSIHASSDLGKVLEGIGNEAGGLWPSQEYLLSHIHGPFSKPGYISNSKMPYLDVAVLTMDQYGPRTTREELHVVLAKKHHE